ncbi:MAG TPA: peptide ligase PGM1-related protein [Acidobacteriota bacterium]|nr:peptide ligase PGM1-related protein [Acidobacteriota bacterium]
MAPLDSDGQAYFKELQAHLPKIWEALESGLPWDHTSVVVPSLSFHPEELKKIPGGPFYEERLLFSLIRLRHPRARVIYLTSQPIHPDIVDYYLQHLYGVPSSHARARLRLMCVYDASNRPLTQKILERPRVMQRLRDEIGDPERAYLTCFNSTRLERQLAMELGIPLNGVDPDVLHLGSKSGSRKIFKEAGVGLPLGFEDVHTEEEIIEALVELSQQRPGLKRAVIKLNESFAGAGNAMFNFPSGLSSDKRFARASITAVLHQLEWSAEEAYEDFLRKLKEMGGIVEEYLQAEDIRSPSVQMRINPGGTLELISSHDQVLGGPTGQAYQGCRFPSWDDYRSLIQEEAGKIGKVLREKGVISRFAIDFVVFPDKDDPSQWQARAIEINLRMGGTTPPFLALQFLTGGELRGDGEFISDHGQKKYYYATDSLRSPRYRGLLPEDFMDILTLHGLHFMPSTETGVIFHMIGALSEFGKVGVTCIGNSREEANELFQQTVEVLDKEADGATLSVPHRPFDKGLRRIE